MGRNGKLLELLELKTVNGRPAFDVPWERAEAIQTHLRRHGVGTTVRVDDLFERRAHLELWEEVSPQRLQEILDQRHGGL
jgi:hypothetical protein